MDNRVTFFIDKLKKSAFDYISLAQSPAEADMLRFLTLYHLNQNNLLNNSLLPRLKNLEPWDFYNTIYDADYAQPINIVHDIANKFMDLKFENELSMNITEKKLSPYHPLLNNLPPLLMDNHIINFKNLKCFKITQAQPYLKLKYTDFSTTTDLKQQIHDLNNITDRNARLNKMVYVKRITDHKHFKELNGQRGVFAKKDIQKGTIIDYYSGEYAQYPQLMPPMLCTWRIQTAKNWFSYQWKNFSIFNKHSWVDAFILGNMMKLVNSCYSNHHIVKDIGNIGCYFFHFKSPQLYLSLPVYVAIKDITTETELLSFYHVGQYQKHRIYGASDYD